MTSEEVPAAPRRHGKPSRDRRNRRIELRKLQATQLRSKEQRAKSKEQRAKSNKVGLLYS